MADKTFVFHSDWLGSLNSLPLEQQDKIIAELVRYGCREPLVHTDDPVVTSMVKMQARSIDNSLEKYAAAVAMSAKAGRKKTVNDEAIYKLAQQGMKSAEIAEELKISKSAVDHSEGWKNRKDNTWLIAEGRGYFL